MKQIREKLDLPAHFPKALQRGVLIKNIQLEAERKGIFIPATAKSIQNEGILYSIGPDCKGDLKIGMAVVYNNSANQYVTYNDERYHLIHEDDVYACISNIDGKDTLFPFNKSVLLTKNKTEEVTVSGLVIVNNEAFHNTGHVMSVGEGITTIKPGQKVVYNFYADFNFPFRGVDVHRLAETDVLCILPDEAISGNSNTGREKRPDILGPKIEKPDAFKGTKFFDPKG